MAATTKVGSSSIAQVTADRITIRGMDLCEDLIGHWSFTNYFLFLLTGEQPSNKLLAMTDACLVAIAEHGFVPSVQAARMTYAAAPDALQGAVSAGLLGCGTVILGASEAAGKLFSDVLERAENSNLNLEQAAGEVLEELRVHRLPVPGFGHPTHKQEDPRATRLLTLADQLGVSGDNVAALRAIEKSMESAYGRFLSMNVSGAIPATLLDAGFPLQAMRGVPLVARTGSLVAHLLEEKSKPLGFKLAAVADSAVEYDGIPPQS